MNLAAVFSTEMLKLRRSRLLWVVAGAPLIFALVLYGLLAGFEDGREPLPYVLFVTMALTIWSFFLLPFSVTLICLISSQVEHSARSWNYILALPVRRPVLFGMKTAIVVGLVTLMSLMIWLLLPLAGYLRDQSGPGMAGTYPWGEAFIDLASIIAAALPMIAIQLWVALRFRGVAAPLAVGIGGGFMSVIVLIGSQFIRDTKGPGRFFPWLMPSEAIRPEPWLAEMVLYGLGGGAVLLALVILDLSRKEYA